MPERIQRRRTAGWRMPPNTIYVGRGSRWGNPFKVGQKITDPMFTDALVAGIPLARGGAVEDRAHAIELFAFWVMAKVPFTRANVRTHLAGRDLACWCPLDQPCHADVLLEIANTPAAATA